MFCSAEINTLLAAQTLLNEAHTQLIHVMKKCGNFLKEDYNFVLPTLKKRVDGLRLMVAKIFFCHDVLKWFLNMLVLSLRYQNYEISIYVQPE